MRTRNTAEGKELYKPSAKHYGQYGNVNSTLPGQKKYKKQKNITNEINTRAQAKKKNNDPNKNNMLKKPPPLPKSPQQVQKKMTTRNDATNVTCLSFGKLRKMAYPAYYFCSHCDLWESYVECGSSSRIKRTSNKFRCEAKHTSPLFPTKLKKNTVHQ